MELRIQGVLLLIADRRQPHAPPLLHLLVLPPMRLGAPGHPLAWQQKGKLQGASTTAQPLCMQTGLLFISEGMNRRLQRYAKCVQEIATTQGM